MKERPILFSGAMVRAILDGRKTQTRRVVKGIPWRIGCNPDFSQARAFVNTGVFHIAGSEEMTAGFRCPYGQPGDRLWVKETWRTAKSLDAKSPSAIGEMCLDAGYSRPWAPLAYGADGHRNSEWRGFEMGGDAEPGKTRVSIHMPRWACRLVLEITGVRVERLQAISDADIYAEGAITDEWLEWREDVASIGKPEGSRVERERDVWERLWASINGQASWDANPWVWVVSFTRVQP